MLKHLLVVSSLLFSSACALAYNNDSTANISSSKVSYEFVYNNRANRVEVKELLTNNYISNGYDVVLPIAELYNDNVSIDGVECKVDKHSVNNFEPKFSYYSVDDYFYSDERICHFLLLLPKLGTTASVTFAETINDPRYFTEIFFPDVLNVDSKEVVIKIPHWMNVEIKEMNFNKLNISKDSVYDKKSDADIITYTVDDLPAMKAEPHSPGPTYVYPHLLILCKSATLGATKYTYFATLDDQYAWYRQLVKSVDNNKELIAAKAKELTAGLSNDMDKIKAIFYYVQDNIRYIAFENGLAGFKPEKADEVLRKKYGDCKGMANLTKALLTSLGYDARLCWLGTNYIAYDYSTPSLAVDNHVICGLNYQGKTMYLDATETYLGLNEYAERIQGRQVLMEDGDKYILGKVPLAAPYQNFDKEKSSLSISGNALTGTVTELFRGEDKEALLAGINSIKKDKSDDALNKYLSDENNNYVISNLNISNTKDPDKDINVSYSVNFKNAISSFSKAYYIDMDRKKEFLTADIKLDKRKHDYWFNYKYHIEKETELAIPAGFGAPVLPPALSISNADYEFHISYTATPQKITYKKTILIKNTHLAKAKFIQWNKDIELLAKTYNQTLILKPLSQ